MLTFVQFITESDKKIFGNNASGFIKPDGSYVIGHTEHDKLARKHNFIDGLDAVKSGWVRWRHYPSIANVMPSSMIFHSLPGERQKRLIKHHIENHNDEYGGKFGGKDNPAYTLYYSTPRDPHGNNTNLDFKNRQEALNHFEN
jgi:hypothetical protein